MLVFVEIQIKLNVILLVAELHIVSNGSCDSLVHKRWCQRGSRFFIRIDGSVRSFGFAGILKLAYDGDGSAKPWFFSISVSHAPAFWIHLVK